VIGVNGLAASLGPAGVCSLLAAAGAAFILGFVFDWRFLYPRHIDGVRYKTGFFYRIYPLIVGISLILCGVLFYIYRDLVNW
jgi:hypothetical protein